MMKPTSNAALRQGAADQSGSQKGEGGGRRRRLRLLLIVLPVFSLWEGWRWEGVKNGGQGSPCGQQLKPCAPWETPTSLQWAAHWSHWISDWHTQPATTTKALSNPSPSNKQQCIQGWLKFKSEPWHHRHRQRWAGGGGGSWGSLGSYKKQMLNHLATPKLVAYKSAGTRGTWQSVDMVWMGSAKTLGVKYNISHATK